MSSKRLLYEILLRNAPSAHWIRGIVASHFGDGRLLAELPDPSGSKASYADAVADAMTRQGLVNDAFLSHLAQNLPNEQSGINDIRRTLSIAMHIEEVVSFDGLMDNWVYQDVAELYADGPGEKPVAFVSVGEEELKWHTECWSGVALESLLAVLSGIVLRDRFFVEERYINAWSGDDSPVLGLHAGGILSPFPEPKDFWKIRSPLYKELLHTPALQRLHKRNSTAYRETGAPDNDYETMVVWGAIGYLARSAVLGVTYVGHPTRRRFLAQTPLSDGQQDAAILTIGKIDAARSLEGA